MDRTEQDAEKVSELTISSSTPLKDFVKGKPSPMDDHPFNQHMQRKKDKAYQKYLEKQKGKKSSVNKAAVAQELVKVARLLSAVPREDYPEGLHEEVNIRLKLDPETGKYMVSCREWKYEGAGGTDPSNAVGKLVQEIVKHNRDEMKG
jgi:hypothetical protein